MANQHVEVGPFSFRAESIVLPMGLAVASVEVTGTGVAIDSKPFALKLNEPGAMVATVTERDLAAFLETQAPGGLHSFEVRADNGQLHVKAKKTVLVDLKVTAVATLRIVKGRQLWIDVVSVDVMGAGAKNLVQSQIDRINPVLDAADLPVDAHLTEVAVGDETVVLRGTVAPR